MANMPEWGKKKHFRTELRKEGCRWNIEVWPATFVLSLQVCESLSPHSLCCLCTSSRLSRKNTTSDSLTFPSLSRKTHDRGDWCVFLSPSFSHSLVQNSMAAETQTRNQASQPTVFRYNDYWINSVWNDEDEKSRSIFLNSALEMVLSRFTDIPVGNTPLTPLMKKTQAATV